MTSKTRTPVLTGGCQCGAVRFAIYKAPERVNLCHCRMCQKAVGGPFAALVPVAPKSFAWTREKPATFVSSNVAERDFCAKCGTPLSYRGPSGRVNVMIGSLDRPGEVRPEIEMSVEQRHAWMPPVPGLDGITTEEELADPEFRAFAESLKSRQHPDHDTPDGWTPEV